MRLLFLTSRLPFPPDRGDRLRAYYLLRTLAPEHAITLVSFIAHESERSNLTALQTLCEAVHIVEQPARRSALTVLANLWRREPLQALYYRSGRMQQQVDELLAQQTFDAIFVHLFRMAPYVAQQSRPYRILDLTDVISREVADSLPYRPWFWRAIYTLELPRIARYECRTARRFDETWLISEVDREMLATRCPNVTLFQVPNGVDCVRFRPLGGPPPPSRLAFVGNMGVFHNADAAVFLAEEIFPRVRAQLPDCTLYLAGAGDHSWVRRLAAQPGVTVTGFVAELNGLLNETAVFVAPLRFSAGVQNKVLEAMAAGVPVVATPRVADGLAAHPGRDLLVGNDAHSLAAQVLRLLHDPDLRTQLAENGRRFVEVNFTWAQAAARLRTIATLIDAKSR